MEATTVSLMFSHEEFLCVLFAQGEISADEYPGAQNHPEISATHLSDLLPLPLLTQQNYITEALLTPN